MSSGIEERQQTAQSTKLSAGDIVRDREYPDRGRAIVVNMPPKSASEWDVRGRGTVASDNPEYPDDDPVAVIIWEDDYRDAFPLYSGGWYIPVPRLECSRARWYAFPQSRLKAVGEVGPTKIPLDRIEPSPYHVRTFDAEENDLFIRKMEYYGSPKTPPLARVLPDGRRVELINGHKRVWASRIAGLDAVWCNVIYMADKPAAQAWAFRHLRGYSVEEQQEATARLRERFSDSEVASILDVGLGEGDG